MWWWVACAAPVPVETAVETAPPPPPAPAWPAGGAPLTITPLVVPEGFGTRRIVVDAGHGAPNNGGNTSCYGEREQDVTLSQARDLAARLSVAGPFEVRLARDGAIVPYADRLAGAVAWGADAIVSLHTDARAGVRSFRNGAAWCTDGAEGLAVLYSDEGANDVVTPRRTIARAIGRRIADAGLWPYLGDDYAGLYAPDEVPGVFVDRHEPRRRIMVLRRSVVPLVIVETHNALDPDEPLRWREPATADAFAAAVAQGLVDALAAR